RCCEDGQWSPFERLSSKVAHYRVAPGKRVAADRRSAGRDTRKWNAPIAAGRPPVHSVGPYGGARTGGPFPAGTGPPSALGNGPCAGAGGNAVTARPC